MGLSAKRVAHLKKPGRYGDGHGLCLQITPSGVKSWLLRYERNGRERWMGLGPLHTIPLKEARERATKARGQLLDGIDPLEARKREHALRALEAAKTISFEEAATLYFDAHERKWRNAKHRAQFLSTLKSYVFPKIGSMAIADIDTGLVLKCIEPIWQAKTETASRVRGRIESVLDWATVRGYRAPGDNPARWRGHLSEVLPARESIRKTAHHPALPYTQVSEFIAELREREGVAALALQFTILTAARTGEVIGARWNEVDLKAKLWTVPAGRIKGGREHRVPLSDSALAILKGLPREANNPFIFVGPKAGGPLSSMAMFMLLRRAGHGNVTVHGFRSTFRDWAAECTAYPNHVVEQALAHTIGNAVEAAYRRSDLLDKRRRLMNDWARYCGSRPMSRTDVVTPIRGGGNGRTG